MSRRKRKVNRPSTTTKHITDSEGWTHIVKGAPPAQSSDAILSSLKSLSLDAVLTPAEVSVQQSRYTSFWADSLCCRNLANTLSNDVPLDSLEMSQCICLGLGSVVNGRHSPRHQLAALTWLHSFLRSHHSHLSEKIIFQDPAFTPSDVQYLESLGHCVVDTPAAFDLVTKSTLLFAPHLERGIYAAALRGSETPALCIAGDVNAFMEQTGFKGDDEDARRENNEVFRRFEEETFGRGLVEYERDPWWYCTKVYWRKESAGVVER